MTWLRWLPLGAFMPFMLASILWSNYTRMAYFLPISLLLGWWSVRMLREVTFSLQSFLQPFRSPVNYYGSIVLYAAFFSLFGSLARGHYPLPMYHDEHAYLLAADTFSRGRLANPTPPGWEHFESYHINLVPAYGSKYQPGMGLALTLGQRLGHPYLGVVITLMLASACWAWMCRQWLPPAWDYLGSLLGVMQLVSVSSDCYFIGGALATIPSSLALGLWKRPLRQWKLHHAILLGGCPVLWFWTRPFEGGLVALLLAGMYLTRIAREHAWQSILTILLPGLMLSWIPAGWFQYEFNLANTGHWHRLPYLEHESQYGGTP
ncbi:MAG TPA: hypothetical protein PKD72_12285, partial [Gemmatales bacterium]|nr:hypothetical protein [Gemmatales bacterium]